MIGLRLDQLVEPTAPSGERLQDCPKCHQPLVEGMQECQHCGVVPQKYLGLKTATRFQGSERLSVLWKKIIDDYENSELHSEFIRLSSVENNLAYASSQYARMLQVMPHDDRASRMIKEIEAIVAVPVYSVRTHTVEKQPARGLKISWVYWCLILGVFFIGVSLVFPMFKNIAGVGAVLLFIPIAVRLKLLSF